MENFLEFNQEFLEKQPPEYFQSLLDWTYPGAALYYRDVELPEDAVAKYGAGQIIRSSIFVDVTCIAGRPATNCRFIVATNKAAPLYVLNPEYEKWAMHTVNANSYFKVMDVYKKDGITQIFLLHVPAKGVGLFKNLVLHADGIDMEQQFIEKARANFDRNLTKPSAPELDDEEWINRTGFPIGMDGNYEFLPLEPDLEVFDNPGTAEIYQFIFRQTKDNELNDLLPEEYRQKDEAETSAETKPENLSLYHESLKYMASLALDADPPEYEQAFQYYEMATEEGDDAEAQYNLAVLYANGLGTEKNRLLAAYWFSKARDKNFHDAQERMTQLSVLYFIENIDSWTEKELFQAALNYYKLLYGIENAVEESNELLEAMALNHYSENEQDYVHAYKCFRAMAEFGDSAAAMYNLAICFYNGRGIKQSDLTAIYWFDKAFDSGHAEAKKCRDDIIDYFVKRNGASTTEFLFNHLSSWCRNGECGVMPDEEKSRYWKEIAEKLKEK
jgi:TPR repeat protein